MHTQHLLSSALVSPEPGSESALLVRREESAVKTANLSLYLVSLTVGCFVFYFVVVVFVVVVSLYSLALYTGLSWTHRNPPDSSSGVLGSKACPGTSQLCWPFVCLFVFERKTMDSLSSSPEMTIMK